jgi:hypothetical protein
LSCDTGKKAHLIIFIVIVIFLHFDNVRFSCVWFVIRSKFFRWKQNEEFSLQPADSPPAIYVASFRSHENPGATIRFNDIYMIFVNVFVLWPTCH